uniref:C2 domain-containing protein n=1 Tax=Panagrellus redivivus TaxID=6233 RepID=A0A7E4V937_PANRE
MVACIISPLKSRNPLTSSGIRQPEGVSAAVQKKGGAFSTCPEAKVERPHINGTAGQWQFVFTYFWNTTSTESSSLSEFINMSQAMRRLSCIPEAISQAIKDGESTATLPIPGRLSLRRPSTQELEDSALLFLERRKSSDSGIGNIQPDLYRKRGSVIKVGNACGSVGRVQMELDYNFQQSDFLVTVLSVEVHSFAAEDCELRLSLGSDSSKRESCRLLSGSLIHKQKFKFAMAYEELLEQFFIIELVMTENAGVTIIKQGRVALDLRTFCPADYLQITAEFEPIHEVMHQIGEINLCLAYLASAQRLSITVQGANGLPKNDAGITPSSLVKAVLAIDGKVLKKRKTSTKKATACPIWNEVLSFEVDPRFMAKYKLDLTVIDVGSNKPLGQVCLGENAGHGGRIWREAMRGGQTKVSRWLPLVPCPSSR